MVVPSMEVVGHCCIIDGGGGVVVTLLTEVGW